MPGFEYGNARLRAMRSRLLSSRELEGLSQAKSLPAMISILATTAYRKPVEASLARTYGVEVIAEALRNDLITTLDKVRCFYSEQAGDTVALILRSYDIHNLKSILRGLAKHAPPGEILNTLLPVSELSHLLLSELTSAPGPRVAIDRLASMNLPIAQPLIQLRGEHPGADLPEMELALDRWYFQQALVYIKENNLTDTPLDIAIRMQADFTNLLTVLRFSHMPSERKLVRQQYGSETVGDLLVGPGFLSFDMLLQAAEQDNIEKAINTLPDTRYKALLQESLNNYLRSGRLSDFEKHFNRYRLKWMSGMIARDPLGVGVVLGYLALKINEVSNIRWIAQGISHGLETAVISNELEYVV